jgi:hypothetical protein
VEDGERSWDKRPLVRKNKKVERHEKMTLDIMTEGREAPGRKCHTRVVMMEEWRC